MSPSSSRSPCPEIRVRRATPEDAAVIRGLIDLYVSDGTLLPRTEEFIAMYARDFIVATVEGDVVGCVHLDEYAPSLAELRSLAVDPSWQGIGVGKTLVGATERLAQVRGYPTLFAVSNDEEFFRKFGFERRHIPELDVERSEVSRYKGVYAKDIPVPEQGAAVRERGSGGAAPGWSASPPA